ncbi:MAG: permease, partial [Phycisphaerae bacterium]
MTWRDEWKKLTWIVGIFLACFWLPVDWARFEGGVSEALRLAKWYARQHVLLCLVPAFFIAGGIGVFVSQNSVMKYLGAKANKVLAYGVASVSGTILAVCSCTVLPLFAGIYRMGAGLGPATAFLYSGPAINVLAIILTARVLGLELGIARAVGAVVFSVAVGVAMHLIFRKEEARRAELQAAMPEPQVSRPLWKNASLFAAMVGILVFANWARSGDVRAVFLCCPGGLSLYQVEGTVVERDEKSVTVLDTSGHKVRIPADRLKRMVDSPKNTVYDRIHYVRWALVVGLLLAFGAMVLKWLNRGECAEWLDASWGFAKQILPLLLIGVLLAGLLLGRPAHEGLIPNRYVEMLVGAEPDMFLRITGLTGGSAEGSLRATWPIWSNLMASLAGALMYFATLTEVPILHGLLGAGMG